MKKNLKMTANSVYYHDSGVDSRRAANLPDYGIRCALAKTQQPPIGVAGAVGKKRLR